MNELKASGKPFDISKWEVWEAWERVKANKGAPGVDGRSVEDFGKDLKNNLYKIWNRMSSGSYFPPPVRAVEIPKSHGGGTRILGVPTDKCRRRCWKDGWVIDLDIQKFFDSVRWDLVVKAVEANTGLSWVVLYVKRWLEAPLQLPDGTLQKRDRGPARVSGIACAG